MGGGGQAKSNGSYPLFAHRPVGVPKTSILRDRIEPFYKSGQYDKVNLLANLYKARFSGKPHVKLYVWSAPDEQRPTFKEAVSHDFKETATGASFGPSWSTHWFRVHLTVPKDAVEEELVVLEWDAGNEGLVWTHDGTPLQGLTGGGERIEWIIPKSYRDTKEHIIYIEMACNGMFGNAPSGKTSIAPPDPNRYYTLSRADIAVVNVPARMLHFDMWELGDAARELPENSAEQSRALAVAMKIIDTFQVDDQESILECRKLAREIIGPDVDSHRVYDVGKDPVVFGIGHCHIDTCWLWPWAETKRKICRSWLSQCDLMDRYPEAHFACSSAQQFKWLKQYYPSAFERVKSKVSDGQFHPIGGSWVEHDTNMPSGESLIRQFFYGQRFFEAEFGARCRTFWLPDTFGYSSQLPQLCRLAGMDRFMTQKLSWNNINTFPHTTFMWVSPDGSQVICHMPPSETYTSEANFGDLSRSISKHKTLRVDSSSLLVFGKGDGGGGPTWQHFEKLRRCAGISNTVGAIPKLKLGLTVDDFFDRLAPKADDFPTWYGELYFELHRGTYTTQANNKFFNRKAEVMLRDIEQLATFASIKSKDYKYPSEKIDNIWEAVLLCQFHDCLPGSSIEMCYDDSDKLYAEVFKEGQALLQDLYRSLGATDAHPCRLDETMVLNTLPWHREEVVQVSDTEVGIASGDGPLLTVRALRMEGDKPAVRVMEDKDAFVLENDHLRVVVEGGCITSLYDRVNGREVVERGGQANKFVIFDDIPLFWEAWDVEVYHLETERQLTYGKTRVHESKPHKVTLVTDIKISGKSSLKAYISLSAAVQGQPSQVDCSAEVDWHEDSRFLKVEFPVEIVNTEASYESAFSITKRPTHYNTSWDMAKFEVCCHKFADLSEHNYGVSILNDSKYGFATVGKTMRLSLLRAPKAPDAHADMGHHAIRWAIFPHKGALSSQTVRAAYAFNNPLKLLSAPAGSKEKAWSDADIKLTNLDESASLILDGVKRGHDDEDVSRRQGLRVKEGQSIVLRVYESLGGRSKGVIRTKLGVKRVTKANVLEDELDEIKFADGAFTIELRPFEVATFKLQL
ncbi:hypothetical protein XA68_16781 [Ophiocordyceps unilateralis]|uniref:Alpha-mannosidase n=1 Tax=Ophiocordyceps unilateralis TaxID=268505 RepID=A0A2A9P4K8_OPHUN|nr:hypothetical protein XA68_16781 [Ophiocordyceps unilateralis]